MVILHDFTMKDGDCNLQTWQFKQQTWWIYADLMGYGIRWDLITTLLRSVIRGNYPTFSWWVTTVYPETWDDLPATQEIPRIPWGHTIIFPDGRINIRRRVSFFCCEQKGIKVTRVPKILAHHYSTSHALQKDCQKFRIWQGHILL